MARIPSNDTIAVISCAWPLHEETDVIRGVIKGHE